MTQIFKPNMNNMLFGINGQALTNGRVHFYDRQSGEYAPIFGDAEGTVPLRQPVQADSSGMLATVYLDDTTDYRIIVADSDNNAVREISNPSLHDDGLKMLNGLAALKAYRGKSDLVFVKDDSGCPSFYTRLKTCDMPPEDLPNIVHGHCCSVWKKCKNETDICSLETAKLTCDSQVLVQDCTPRINPAGAPASNDCHCSDNSAGGARSTLKKASIGDLLSAAGRCLPLACIPFEAPELALGTDGSIIAGDREPLLPETSAMHAFFGACLKIFLATDLDTVAHHFQMDGGVVKDLNGKLPTAPEITLTNDGNCQRQYEIRALNRLNRAIDSFPFFGQAPRLAANLQTRLGIKGDTRLDSTFGVTDFFNTLPWLTRLSIADSTMGPFKSGHYDLSGSDGNVAAANAFTENTLLYILNPGQTVTFAVKYHIYWDQYATKAQLDAAERLHFGTRIIARRVR